MKRKDSLLLLTLIMNFTVTIAALTMYHPSGGSIGPKEGYLFTFAHITDSHLPKSEAISEKAISWLAANDNISFVVHTGDIVHNPLDETAWETAYQYMHQLDDRCSWAVLAGNHDVLWGRVDLTNYEKYFGNDSVDHYHIIEDRILFILLSWINRDGSISKERLEWMDTIIQKHGEMPVAICLHPHLSGLSLLNIFGAANAEEIWSHINKHQNVIMALSGHLHQNWVHTRSNGERDVWSIITEALNEKGYIRLFDVYEDRIEIYAYSPWTDQTYTDTLDRLTIRFKPDNHDADRDLWSNSLDIMPTHPLVPNTIFISIAITMTLSAYWIKNRFSTNSGFFACAYTVEFKMVRHNDSHQSPILFKIPAAYSAFDL